MKFETQINNFDTRKWLGKCRLENGGHLFSASVRILQIWSQFMITSLQWRHGTMASQITSLTIVYSTVIQAEIKENIKAPRHWPLRGEFTGNAEGVSIGWRHHVLVPLWLGIRRVIHHVLFSCIDKCHFGIPWNPNYMRHKSNKYR